MGQFKPEQVDQFKPEWVGQFGRNLQWGLFPFSLIRPKLDNALNLFREITKQKQRSMPHNVYHTFKTINIYKGVVDFDSSFNEHLKIQILKLISIALKAVEKIVQNELQWQESVIKSKQSKRIDIREITGHQNIIFDSM